MRYKDGWDKMRIKELRKIEEALSPVGMCFAKVTAF